MGRLFIRLRSHGIALSIKLSSAPKGRAAHVCDRPAAQPSVLPGRSDSAPKGRTADCKLRVDRREPQQLVDLCAA